MYYDSSNFIFIYKIYLKYKPEIRRNLSQNHTLNPVKMNQNYRHGYSKSKSKLTQNEKCAVLESLPVSHIISQIGITAT